MTGLAVAHLPHAVRRAIPAVTKDFGKPVIFKTEFGPMELKTLRGGWVGEGVRVGHISPKEKILLSAHNLGVCLPDEIIRIIGCCDYHRRLWRKSTYVGTLGPQVSLINRPVKVMRNYEKEFTGEYFEGWSFPTVPESQFTSKTPIESEVDDFLSLGSEPWSLIEFGGFDSNTQTILGGLGSFLGGSHLPNVNNQQPEVDNKQSDPTPERGYFKSLFPRWSIVFALIDTFLLAW
jgi:hypothetical protein